MTATVGPITSFTLERCTQLINKSNQFNLTTIRRSTAEIQAIAADTDWFTFTISLKDRFGDNGLISVLLGKVENESMKIDTWVMSCRVLKRQVEHLMLNLVCQTAMDRGLKKIVGSYIPTEKNVLVKEHYPTLGFTLVNSHETGRCDYELLLDNRQPFKVFIETRVG